MASGELAEVLGNGELVGNLQRVLGIYTLIPVILVTYAWYTYRAALDMVLQQKP